MNDFSERRLQLAEMKLSLRLMKGKGYATAIGPHLVTSDELAAHKVEATAGHVGTGFDLEMTCAVIGTRVSKGNFADMHWTFAKVIGRISHGVDVYPGDVIGSASMETGCCLELNATKKSEDP